MTTNKPSDGGGTIAEHKAMLSCKCTEADQLYGVCLFCGKVSLPDPSWLVVAIAAVFFLAHVAWWVML